MQAYCVKCRTKREMKDPKSITMKNGKPATQGICPSCGTQMFRIGKSQTIPIESQENSQVLDILITRIPGPCAVGHIIQAASL